MRCWLRPHSQTSAAFAGPRCRPALFTQAAFTSNRAGLAASYGASHRQRRLCRAPLEAAGRGDLALYRYYEGLACAREKGKRVLENLEGARQAKAAKRCTEAQNSAGSSRPARSRSCQAQQAPPARSRSPPPSLFLSPSPFLFSFPSFFLSGPIHRGFAYYLRCERKERAPGDQHRSTPNAHLIAPWPMELD